MLTKPSSLKYNDDGSYSITQENGRKEKIIPTTTDDGHNLIVIKGSGLPKWGIDGDGSDLFPKSENFGSMKGEKVAIAVMKGDELLGVAFGRDNGNKIVFDRVQKTDGITTKLFGRIEVEVERVEGRTVIKSGADEISKAVVNRGVASQIENSPKFPVASVDSPSAPLTFSAGKPSKEQGLA